MAAITLLPHDQHRTAKAVRTLVATSGAFFRAMDDVRGALAAFDVENLPALWTDLAPGDRVHGEADAPTKEQVEQLVQLVQVVDGVAVGMKETVGAGDLSPAQVRAVIARHRAG